MRINKIALPLILTSLAAASCSIPKDRSAASLNALNKTNETSQERNSLEELSQRLLINRPQIDEGNIFFMNSNGQMVKLGIVDRATLSLYSAIRKYSTVSETDIEDISGFYTCVESNIPKNEVPCVQTRSYDDYIMQNTESINISLRHLQCQQLFTNLFNIFTSSDSEKGKVITVGEYTRMMEAWASTGIQR